MMSVNGSWMIGTNDENQIKAVSGKRDGGVA